MIGNDVVDLDDQETATEALHPRFDLRVFTADERRRLVGAEDRRALRWTLWAAKESAFKLAKRLDPGTVFAHALFETELGEDGCGQVRYRQWRCAVAVSRVGSAIHAIATAGQRDRQRVVAGLGHLSVGDDPSARVRVLAMTSVARFLHRKTSALTVTAGDDRIPVLRIDGRPSGSLSLTHHGAFTAFAWMLG